MFTNLSTIICFTFSSSTQEGHLIGIDEDGGSDGGSEGRARSLTLDTPLAEDVA